MKYRKTSLFLVALMLLGIFSVAFVMVPSVSAHTITVDGDPSDWYADASGQAVNTGEYYVKYDEPCGGEYVWKDAEGDDTGNGTYTYPTTYSGMEADLLEFRVTSDADWLYMLVRLADIVPGQSNRTHLAICVDTTPDVAGDGLHEWVWQEADVKLSDGTGVKWNWQYLLGHWKGMSFFMGDTQPWVEFIGLPASKTANDSTTNCFEIAINKSHCGDYMSETWRFGVFVSLHDRHDSVWEASGNAHEYRFMEVLETATATNGGGASGDSTTHDRDANVYDCAFFSTTAAQEAALDDWDRVGDNPVELDPSHMGAFEVIQFSDTPEPICPTPTRLYMVDDDGDWNLTCKYKTSGVTDFDMNVWIENVTSCYGWQFGLEWDPAVVNLTGYTVDYSFIGPVGNTIKTGGVIDHVGGTMSALAVVLTTAPGTGKDGTGRLCVLHFHALTEFQLAGHWINFTDVKIKDDSSPSNTIPTHVDNAWFWCPPPAPYGPTAIIDEDPEPYWVDSAINIWSESTDGFNGTAMVPIDNETWTIFDSLATIVYGPTTIDGSGTSISFTPTYADTYTVLLEVVTEPDAVLDPGMNYDSTTEDKFVQLKAATYIDCFTERERWSGYTTSHIGLGPNGTADTYALDENVTIYAEVVYNDWPRQSVLVSFEVYAGCDGDLVLLRTALTNESGIATISFRIMTVCGDPEAALGKWHCHQKVYMCEEYYEDELWFEVAWVVELQEVIPYKDGIPFPYLPAEEQYYNPGDIMKFAVFFKNHALEPRHILMSIVVYDDDGVPIVNDYIECIDIPGGEFCEPYEAYPLEFFLEIPKWVYCGWATVYVNLFNDWPNACGHPWCPEISNGFLIKAPIE